MCSACFSTSLRVLLYTCLRVSLPGCAQRGTISLDKATGCEICAQGNYAMFDNSSVCEECPLGQYGNMSQAHACVDCPEGTGAGGHTRTGGDRMRTCCKPGYWADKSAGHDTCYKCANKLSCVGNGDCEEGFDPTSNWCAACLPNWFQMGGMCQECPENSAPMVIGAVISFLILSAMIVNIATTKGGSKKSGGNIMKEVAATPMSILFTRLQVSLPVFKLGMSWPEWLIEMMGFFKGIISLDVSAMTAPECFSTGDPATMYVSRAVTKLFVFPALCLCMTLIFQFFQIFVWGPKGVRAENYATYNSWVAAYSFLFVMLVNSGFEPFGCTTVAGVPLLDAQVRVELIGHARNNM